MRPHVHLEKMRPNDPCGQFVRKMGKSAKELWEKNSIITEFPFLQTWNSCPWITYDCIIFLHIPFDPPWLAIQQALFLSVSRLVPIQQALKWRVPSTVGVEQQSLKKLWKRWGKDCMTFCTAANKDQHCNVLIVKQNFGWTSQTRGDGQKLEW